MADLPIPRTVPREVGFMSDPVIQEPVDRAAADSQQFRSQVGHISRHSGTLFAGTVFTAATSYLFKIYLARVLGAEMLGVYALGITMMGFVGVFNSLGLPESAVRFAAEYRAGRRLEPLRSLLIWGGGILLLSNAIFAVFFLKAGRLVALRFYHSPRLAQYLPWFVALMVTGAISVFYGRIMAGYNAVGRRTIITNFVGSPTTMVLAVLFITIGWGFAGYLLAQFVSAGLVIGLMLIVIWRLTPVESRHLFPWPRPLERKVLSFSAAASGVLMLEFLMGQMDKIALGAYLGAQSVGIYSVAAAVVAYETLALNSVNQVFSPMIAGLYSTGDRAMLSRLYKALTKWVFAVTVPLAITVVVFARPILRMFGHTFEAGWPILIIGTIGQLVNCGVGSVALLLFMSGHQRRLLRVQVAMAGVLAVSSIALIPIWGIVGAAVASAITNVGINLWNFLEVRTVLEFSPFSRSFARLALPALASIIIASVVRAEGGFRHDWLAIGVSLIATYGVFAAITAAMGLDSDDRLIGSAIWTRIRQSIPNLGGIQS
jgi:O-antigen/teichoic acid export membrane protein